MKNLFLKVVPFIAVIMVITCMGMTVSAYEYPDEGYWANEAIDAAIDNGLLRGKDDGKMHSEDNLTRAEMAAIMVRAFGATIEADIDEYVDLDPSAWYYKDFAKAVQMRVFEGDGTGHMRPNDYITREEVFAVVARALVLNTDNYSALDKFNDKSSISSWSKGYMSILAQKSYVNGDNLGNCNPKNNITRAEFAQLMHNIFRNYYSKPNTYTGNTDSHSSMINVGNVTFKNVTINKDLVIGDGDAKGTIRLENVNIKGRLLVRGSNRVELVNTTVGEMVVVNNYNTVVHFDNYRDEKVFNGIILNTEATFKEKAKPTPGGSGGGGGATTSYTVTYDVDGGSAIPNGTAYKNKSFTLPGANSTTKNGFVLKGWIVNGTQYAPGAKVSGIKSNITVKAVWEAVSVTKYIITFDVDGGNPAIDDKELIEGDDLVLPAVGSTTKTGYVLDGWIVNGIKYVPGATVSGITADTTVKAVWTAETYDITFDVDGGSAIPNGTAKYGEDFVLPGNNTTTKTGFYLKGWMVNGTEYAPGAKVSGITEDTTIKAVWEAVTPATKYGSYTVQFYKQNTDLTTYQHITADDITVNNVVVGSFTYTADADKYVGFDLNSNYVSITKDITENGNTVFEVRYDRESYTVTYDEDGGTDINSGKAYYGKDFTLPAVGTTTKTGYVLNGWIVNGTKYAPGATVSGITTDTTAKAVWVANTYTVTFDVVGGSPIPNGTATYGQDFTLPGVGTTSKTGYILEGWTVNGTKYAPGATVSGIEADTTIKAVWTAETYEITYDVDGGTPINKGSATYGQDFTLPGVGTTSKTGYILEGWTVNGTKYAPGATVSGIEADTTIKAVWTAETYTITYNTDGGSIIPPTSVKYGDDLTLPAVGSTTKTGYVLKGWNVNGTKYLPGATVSGISADTTIKAVWELETYTVIYDVDGGSAIPNGTAKYGEDFVLPGNNATTKTGFYLKGWMVNGTEYAPGAKVSGITADTTIKAVWEAVTPATKYGSYTVQFYQQNTDLTTYQHITADDITVNNVVVGSFTYTADADKYVGFDLNSNYVSITKDITENGNTVFEVRYDRETYAVEYNTDGGTAMSEGTAYYGIDFTLPALGSTTKIGWVLTGWEVNGTQYGLGEAVSGITTDTTAKAIWTRETYTVTYDVDGGTPIDDDTATFGYGFTLPGSNSTTKTGHILKGWIVNGTTHNPGTTVAGIDADITIKAVWEVETYDVTFNTDGGSAIAPTTVKYGEVLTLPAVGSTTKTGYSLVGWMVKGTQYNPGATVSDITADTEVLAVWKLDEYTITYDVDGGTSIADGKAYYGVDFTLPNIGSTTKTGHILKGWTINGTQYDLGATVSGITSDTTVKAVWEAETYTVTYDVDGGSAIAPETITYGDDLVLPADGSTTKDGYRLVGWTINGTKYNLGETISNITSNLIVKAIWEVEIPGIKYGSYVIKYYKQNANGQYDYVSGDDESGTAEVGSYTISVNSNKYDGYVLSANNVYTMDITEGQTTEFKVYYDIKPVGVEYNTVTFYYRTNVVGTTDVENGTTVPEAQFPDYMRTYSDGYVKDSTISSVYTTPYQHTVDYGWWYNPESDKWEEFTTETVVKSDMDVYLKISKFNTIVTLASGEQFNFYAFYESDTRFIDTVKDILYKRGPLEALKVSGYMDKVREKGIVQKVLDTDDNIMMLSYMVKFSQILGEENVEKFIVDNAKEMFASGDNELLHDAFVEYIIAVANSTNDVEKKKVHDLMEETINHIFEEDEISTETLDLIRDLCYEVLNDPDTFKEVTGYELASLPGDTKTFVIDYIILQLSENDEMFEQLVEEVIGVDYTETTTTKDLIIAMAEKELTDNFDATIDDIKDSQKDLIVNTVDGMLSDSSNGLYDEVLTYAVDNEKATIISTIKTLLETEDSLYDEVIAIVADDVNYRAMVAESVGTELAANDALFEVLTGYDPAIVPDRTDAIDTLKDEITNDKSRFETAITDAENAGYKSFITESVVSKLETNAVFFNAVLEEAKADYRDTMVDTMVDKLEEPNSPMYDKVIELAKTDAYKQTIKDAVIDEMNGANGDDMIIAITGCTAEELAKDPQDKDGFIMNKVEEQLDDEAYLISLVESVTGFENYTLPAEPKDFIIDMVIAELSNTDSTSAARDMIIEEAIAYLLESKDEAEISHIADYAISYLANHPDERDEMVDSIINDVYKDELDKLVYQLINEEQFEVHADTVFVAEGLKKVLLEDYNYETLFGSKVPEKLEKVFEIYPEEKLIELYDYAMNNLIAQIDTAIADAVAGNTGYIDSGITPVVNIISDIYVPLYESYKKIIEGPVDDKVGDNFYYAENIYLQELMKLLDPTVWVQGSANAKPSDTTGYKIYDIDYYYDLFYKIYVLGDDALLWYYNNISEEKYIEVTEKYEEVILKYVNIIADKVDLYVIDGEIPKVNEKVDDKISAVEKAIVEKYPELVKGMIDKYKATDFFNKDYTSVDYDKVRDKVYDVFSRTLHMKTDEYFDKVLNREVYEKVEAKLIAMAQDFLEGRTDNEDLNKVLTQADFEKIKSLISDMASDLSDGSLDGDYNDRIRDEELIGKIKELVSDKAEDLLDGKLDGEYYTKIDDDTYEFEVNDYMIRFIRELKNTLY